MDQFGIMVGLKKKASFEGWFVKIDDTHKDLILSVIWGYSTHKEDPHAFLQFQDSLHHETTYLCYPISALTWQMDPFQLKIGGNQLSKEEMILDFETKQGTVQGTFTFGPLTPIKTSFLKPNIMGWLTYLPNECNHSITSMRHQVTGTLRMGNQLWDLDEAVGYIEKDWGTGFPKEYVWLQTNDWEDTSLAFSYATVPMLGNHQKGFFLLLQHQGMEYRFSSIEGSRMEIFKTWKDGFEATVIKGNICVTLKAQQSHPLALASPDHGLMQSKIKESIDGTCEMTLKIQGAIVAQMITYRASIDVHMSGPILR